MKYWIIIDSWNLLETFITESISPHAFYLNRAFGNDLRRFICHNAELYYRLVLYVKEPESQYAIAIDDSLLDKDLLMRTKGRMSFTYPKTIYYTPGAVWFRFKDETSLRSFIAESKIIIELKTLERYQKNFYVDPDIKQTIPFTANDILPYETEEYIKFDNWYNSVKGAIIAYVCGHKNTLNPDIQSTLLAFTNLKNKVAGLFTTIMMAESASADFSTQQRAFQFAKMQFVKAGFIQNNQIYVLSHIMDEIISLSRKRLLEVEKKDSEDYKLQIETLKHRRNKCLTQMSSIENTNIKHVIKELDSIKSEEVENGKKEGKNRMYLKKDTPQYNRKQLLKNELEQFKKENTEYNRLYNETQMLTKQINDISIASTEYDGPLTALFTRFSDNVNDIIHFVRSSFNEGMDCIHFDNILISHRKIEIKMGNVFTEELVYYNLLLNEILELSQVKHIPVSDALILDLLKTSAQHFSENGLSDTETGQHILQALRNYWLYKNQKIDMFTIPQNLKLFEAIMSFFIKFRGIDQIDRFMSNKNYEYKDLAYMLWGCLQGYASLPKTLTAKLYNEEGLRISNVVDSFIFKLLEQQ